VLRDPEKRQRYDRYGHAGLDGMNMPNFNDARSMFGDLFGDILGGLFGHDARHGPARGRDHRVEVELDLEEVARGGRKEVTVHYPMTCPACRGTG